MAGKEQQTMIPYIAYESMLAKEDKQQKRLIIALIVISLTLIVLLATSNLLWWVAWNQYDYVDEDYSTQIDVNSEGEGNANYIGNDGDINNGKSNGNEDTESKSKNT